MRISDWSSDVWSSDLVDVEFFTGKKIFGQSRAGSIIRQLTDDVPIHRFCIRLMHSCEFRDLTYSYANMQTGKTGARVFDFRSEEHTSELQSLMRISYAVFCLKKKQVKTNQLLHTKQ